MDQIHLDLQRDNEGNYFTSNIEFWTKYRMTRDSFFAIVDMIRDNEIFTSNQNETQQQHPPEYKVLLLLRYLGTQHHGDDSHTDNGWMVDFLMIDKATAQQYKEQAMQALRGLKNHVIQWPDVQERKEIKKRIESKFGVPNCFGLIDGTLLPVSFPPRPVETAADMIMNSWSYAVEVVLVCDDERLIRYHRSGLSSNGHDVRVWKDCKLYKFPNLYFQSDECVVADSSYDDVQPHQVVAEYKVQDGVILDEKEEHFNEVLAEFRTVSNQTVEILTTRFSWFRSSGMLMGDNKAVNKVIENIDVCIVLHNLLMKRNDIEMLE